MSALRRLLGGLTGGRRTAAGTPPSTATPSDSPPPYPGDYEGPLGAPFGTGVAGGRTGEVVWAWVPYEEDHDRGKDRPVLVVGGEGRWLLALPMTSVDHDVDEEQEHSAGRYWIDVGAGDWDRRRRRSEARVDRVVRVDSGSVRRDGATLAREVYDAVLAACAAHARGEEYDDDPA